MNIQFPAVRPDTDTLAFILTRPLPAVLPIQEGETVLAAAAASRFKGETGETFTTFVRENGSLVRIVLVGADAGAELDFELAGAAMTAHLTKSGAKHAAIDLPSATTAAAAVRFALGARLRAIAVRTSKSQIPEETTPTLDTLSVLRPDAAALWAAAASCVEGVAFTRSLVTDPPNLLFPETFAEHCRRLEPMGVRMQVFDRTDLARLGMGALLGVAAGASSEPRVVVLEWNGLDDEDAAPIVFIGKGVTFDSGGISIKPAAGMEAMKFDMGGAAAVAGTIRALAVRGAKARVIGICGLVENMPDGAAMRPGDVVTSMSGKTIEVVNTDAEGRLVLCDLLTWAQRTYKPEVIVDLATLTGSILATFGNEYAGLFSNDDKLAEALSGAGALVNEKLWRMPLSKAYDKALTSDVADMNNLGGRYAGAITAAQFLKRFIDDGVKWAHLDIAGTVWADSAAATWDKGATGFGVRLLDAFVSARSKAAFAWPD
ncbi:leucyl aminopeptidase (plasmid) [Novosphingobium resinovorum]|uniref:leucyl aminopeptidase n=1 Tax=Novosphingobium TaxID=165696 RepID=UPI001B3C8B42|nr:MULTISPECIES: leucyl aminopeptidase [Novosphingobium]MBF7015275.1 leucyl aminopeptidase [Novosphingobium sp. HR1a]WJM29951.1 leucyl aminopeptidase [Novosphingobium resinovorum]